MSEEKHYWRVNEVDRFNLFEQSQLINPSSLRAFTQNPMPLDSEMCSDFISQAEELKNKIDSYVDAVKKSVTKTEVIYLHHPESDDVFVELPENLSSHLGQCDELSFDEYLALKEGLK